MMETRRQPLLPTYVLHAKRFNACQSARRPSPPKLDQGACRVLVPRTKHFRSLDIWSLLLGRQIFAATSVEHLLRPSQPRSPTRSRHRLTRSRAALAFGDYLSLQDVLIGRLQARRPLSALSEYDKRLVTSWLGLRLRPLCVSGSIGATQTASFLQYARILDAIPAPRMASIGVCPRKTGAAKPSAQTPAPVPPSTA